MKQTVSPADAFLEESHAPRAGFASEMWVFLRQSRRWWMLPIIATLVVLGLVIMLGSSVAAPFIYPLF